MSRADADLFHCTVCKMDYEAYDVKHASEVHELMDDSHTPIWRTFGG